MSGLKVVFEDAEESNNDSMEKLCHGSCDIMSMHGRCDSMFFLQRESVVGVLDADFMFLGVVLMYPCVCACACACVCANTLS